MFQNCCEEEYEENIPQNDTENNCLDNNDENQEDGDPASKWSLFEFKQYFIKNNIGEKFISVWKGIKDIVIKTLITNKNNTMREIPYNKTTKLFEVYGFDIIIDNKFRPWLLEVNVNPSLHCSSPLDMSIKTDLITDVINIIGIQPIHHQIQDVCYTLDGTYKTKLEMYRKCNNICEQNIKGREHSLVRMEKWKNIYNRDCYIKMIEYNEEEEERVKVTDFERIFPDKQNIGKYSKFINCITVLSDWDIVFWSYLMNKENKKEVNFMNADKEEIRQEKNEN